MIDLLMAGTVAKLASDAVSTFDKMYRGYTDFIKKKEPTAVPYETPPDFAYADDPNTKALVAKSRSTGQIYQSVKYEQLAQHLNASDLAHIEALNSAILTYQKQWDSIFKQRPAAGLGLETAKLDTQLDLLANEISNCLLDILDFIQRVGLHLDDHYHASRQTADNYLKANR